MAIKPIVYWNCTQCNYPIYSTRDDLLLTIARIRKCPNCLRLLDPYREQANIKDERPDDSTWREQYVKMES